MTDQIDQRVSALKAKVNRAIEAKARAEYARDAATATREKAMASLAADFGVSTVEEARELLISMEKTLAEAVAETEKALEAAK